MRPMRKPARILSRPARRGPCSIWCSRWLRGWASAFAHSHDRDDGKMALQIMAENDDFGLTIDECEAISHAVSDVLDVETRLPVLMRWKFLSAWRGP